MGARMQQQSVSELDKLCLDGRKRLSMSGVETVDSFSDQMLKLTVSANKVIIVGENIKITSYDKDKGQFNAEGNFTEIKYVQKKGSLMKRLFK
ncbi:MAG: hypothetical protein E7346_06990 [Clostridiales bacterium]|nr:hypothetical protein [Clostridiales bacterium]